LNDENGKGRISFLYSLHSWFPIFALGLRVGGKLECQLCNLSFRRKNIQKLNVFSCWNWMSFWLIIILGKNKVFRLMIIWNWMGDWCRYWLAFNLKHCSPNFLCRDAPTSFSSYSLKKEILTV
jgi:hypothetical protein